MQHMLGEIERRMLLDEIERRIIWRKMQIKSWRKIVDKDVEKDGLGGGNFGRGWRYGCYCTLGETVTDLEWVKSLLFRNDLRS